MSKREDLVDAAKSLLWERGYAAMSPRAVQRASGAGQGSFYHHFTGKRDLAATALGDVAREMESATDAIYYLGHSSFEKLSRYLTLPRDALKGCRLGRLAHEASIEEPQIRGPVADYFGYVEARAAATLAGAVRDGEIAPDANPGDIAASLVAVVQGGYVLARAHRDPDYMARATRGALAMLSALYGNSDRPGAGT